MLMDEIRATDKILLMDEVRMTENIRTQMLEKLSSEKNLYKQNMERRFTTLKRKLCRSSEKGLKIQNLDRPLDDDWDYLEDNIPELTAPLTTSLESSIPVSVIRSKRNCPEFGLPSVQSHFPKARSITDSSMAFPDSTWACSGYLVRLEISPEIQRNTEEANVEWFIETFPPPAGFLRHQQEMRKHFRSDNFKFASASWNLFIALDRKNCKSLFGINIRERMSTDMLFDCKAEIEFYRKGLFRPLRSLNLNFECRDADSYGLVENFFSYSELDYFLNLGYLINCKIAVLKSRRSAVAAPAPTGLSDVHRMSQDMKSLLMSGEESDVTIQVGDQQFKAHRIILKTRSFVFAAMFHQDSKENATGIVNIEDCDPSSFPVLLEFLYCGCTENLSVENVFGVYSSADKFDVQDLKRKCFQFIKSNLSVDNYCKTVRLYLQHSEADLLDLVVKFFSKHFRKIISKPEWKALQTTENPYQVYEIYSKALSSDAGDD